MRPSRPYNRGVAELSAIAAARESVKGRNTNMKMTFLALAFAASSMWAAVTEPARVTKYTNAPPESFGLAARTAGTVELQLEIDTKGNLANTRIVKGRPDLVQAAVRTVRGWHFASAKVDGRNVHSRFNVVLAFDFSK